MPTISILTPVFDRTHQTGQFLASLNLQTNTDFECILIDNHSPVNIRLKVKDYQFELRYLYLKKNYMFSQSLNPALKLCQGEWVWILNSDVYLFSNTIAKLHSHLKSDQDMPDIIYHDIWQKKHGLIASHLTEGRGGRPVYDRFRGSSQHGPLGCSILLHHTTIQQLIKQRGHVFNPAMGFYFSDYELGQYLQRMNAVTKYVPILAGIHCEGISTPQNPIPSATICKKSFFGLSPAFRRQFIRDRKAFLKHRLSEYRLNLSLGKWIEANTCSLLYICIHFIINIRQFAVSKFHRKYSLIPKIK